MSAAPRHAILLTVVIALAALGFRAPAPVVGATIDLDTADNSNLFLTDNAAVAYNPGANEFLVVYTDWDASSDDRIVGRRISAFSGERIGSAIEIDATTIVSFGDQPHPAVAWAPGAGRYLVAYQLNDTVVARLLDGAGADVGGGSIAVDDLGASPWLGDAAPEVAFDGTNFLVVWVEPGPGGDRDVRGRRFDTSGAALGPSFGIDTTTNDTVVPSLAWMPAPALNFLVAYAANPGDGSNRAIAVRAVAMDETVGAETVISTAADNCDWPRLAADAVNQQFLAVWVANDIVDAWAGLDIFTFDPVTVGDIWFRRLQPDGTPAGTETALQSGADIDVGPTVAYSPADAEFVIAWQRGPLDLLTAGPAELRVGRLTAGTDTIVENATALPDDLALSEVAPVMAAAGTSAQVLGVYLAVEPTAITTTVHAFRFRTSASAGSAPSAPTGFAQFQLDGTTPVAIGGSSPESGIRLRTTLTDPDTTEPLTLEVEVRPLDTAAAGAVTAASPAVVSGGTAEVTLAGLSMPASRHWRARTVDGAGNVSAWTDVGSNLSNPPANPCDPDFILNSTPLAPTGLGQFSSDGATPVNPGGLVSGSVVLKATVNDADAGDQLVLHVEVVPDGSPFTGTATASSSAMSPGSVASVTVGGLSVGAYRWQAWSEDAASVLSPAVEFGPLDPDFSILVGKRRSGPRCSLAAASHDPSRLGALAALMVVAALVYGRLRVRS